MTAPPPRHLRTDIQALRGFAVLVVLLYHAKIDLFAAGYLGVDVFFVISGFLITRLIKDGIASGTFRFSDFYFRRAKRLLPAAYVTFLATALLSPLFLTSIEMEDFRAQMIGAVTFTGNIVLWQQAGYFGGAAELKPLLHVWSLAIEEQYYFLLPAMLVFIPRRHWLRVAVLILLVSLTLCFARSGNESTFYLLPTRAWELMIGSVGALIQPGERLGRVIRIAFWPALASLLALPLVKLGNFHPGPAALAICLASLVVILRQHPILLRGAGMRVMSRVGDMSYSLYLVHWPLFAFLNNAWIEETSDTPSIEIRIGLIVLSLLLAYLLNRYVEEPARHANIKATMRVLARTVAVSLSVILVTSGIVHATAASRDFKHIRRVNHGMGKSCEFNELFTPRAECRNSDHPEILVWGDSYAMHLVPGILGTRQDPPHIVQATRSACGPLSGLAVVETETAMGYDEKWAERCIAFNASVVTYLAEADSVTTVVLSSPFQATFDKTRFRLLKLDEQREGGYQLIDADMTEAIAALGRTIETIRALGKRVVVVAPPPSGGFDVGRCVERLESGLLNIGATDDCRISTEAYQRARGDVLDFLSRLRQSLDVDVISFDSYLCDSKACKTYIDGTFIYRDGGHLSHEGSVFLANAVSLIDQVQRRAR